MDCHGVPTEIVGRMNGPALPVSRAIELQCGYCCEGKYPQGLAAKESRGKASKSIEDLALAKARTKAG